MKHTPSFTVDEPRLWNRFAYLTALSLPLLAASTAAFAQANYATPYTFITLAGATGDLGSADGTGGAARFNVPFGVAVDTNGNVYVADNYNEAIRKVTPTGVVTTLAGGGLGNKDGTGGAAQFNDPLGLAVDTQGNVYVADTQNGEVRKVTPAGVVTTLSNGGAAPFNGPFGLAVDANGNVYVADTFNNAIRKLTPAGVATTLAGGTSGSTDGTGSAAQFMQPHGVAVDANGIVYVADFGNNSIRQITPEGVVTTLAGGSYGADDGIGSAAQFNNPFGVAVDTNGSIYVGDESNNRIRRVTPSGVVTTLAGSIYGSANAVGSAAGFNYPGGVAVDLHGNIYVADIGNGVIRKGFFTPFAVAVTANPSSGTAPLTVQFTAANTDSAGNAITNWSWDFGDGSTSTLQNPPSHSYQTTGTFSPSLVATNDLGNTVGSSLPPITVAAPTLEASANPTTGTLPLSVHFTSGSTDSGGHPIAHWKWDFNDGSTSTLQNPSHTYESANYFYPSLAATNNLGVAVASSVPSISVSFPTVQFFVNTNFGSVPLAVHFTSLSTDSGGNTITRRYWTFGDGATSTAQNPIHTFSTTGMFEPSLVVTNSHGTEMIAPGTTIFAQPVASPSGLVSNGGFETGDFSGWTLKDSGIYGYDLVDTFYQSVPEGMEPCTGLYFARLGQSGAPGYLSQTLATTPGASYLFSFWLNSPDGLAPNEFSATWNGTTLFSQTNLTAFGTNGSAEAWTKFQFLVFATDTSTVIRFGFQDDPTALGLDDVSALPAQTDIFALSLFGTSLVVDGSNGLAGETYALLAGTNLTQPLNLWVPVASTVLTTSGNFTVTASNAVNPSVPQTFYVIRLQ